MTLQIGRDTIRDTLHRFAGKELEALFALDAAVKWDLRVKISEKWKVEGGKWKVEGGKWKVEGGKCKKARAFPVHFELSTS